MANVREVFRGWSSGKYRSSSLRTDNGSVSSNFKPVFHVDAKGYFASCRVLKDLGLRWPPGDPEMEYNQAVARQRPRTPRGGGR